MTGWTAPGRLVLIDVVADVGRRANDLRKVSALAGGIRRHCGGD